MNEAEATATRARARRPLLVTGSHRSGTTWVGQVLAGTGAYAYVHEPFNASLFPRLTHIRLGGHYTYVTEANETAYLESVTDVLAHRFPFREQVREVRTPQQAAKLVREWGRSTARRLGGRPALVKDPIALFAAEWMAQRFDVDVLVMVRHPAAFVSSIKRLGWEFDFEYWTRQPLLLRDELPALAGEIEAAARERPDRIGQAILLWRAIHTVIARLADEHPEWLVVRHEDLSADPIGGFRSIFERLDLPFDDEAERHVAAFSDEGNAKEAAPGDKGPVRRDSRAAVWTWTKRLTPEEIARVRRETADVAPRFYADRDWLPPTTT